MDINRFFKRDFSINEINKSGYVAIGNKDGSENMWVNVNVWKNYLKEFYQESKNESLKKAFRLYIEGM